MRKFLSLTVLAMGACGAMVAAPVPCPTTTTLAALIALDGVGDGCISQDKIFNNFSYTGGGTSTSSSVDAQLVFTPGPSNQDIHGWIFAPSSGPWTTAFTLSYSISVAPSAVSGVVIEAAKDQINSGLTPNGVIMTDTQTPNAGAAQTVTTRGVLGQETSQVIFAPSPTSIATTSALALSAGNVLQSYEQDWFEAISSSVPEPSSISYALLGGGFLLIGLLRIKKKSA